MAPRSEPEFCVVAISTTGAELGEMVRSIWLRAHEGANGKGLGGNVGENVKRMSRNNVREVRDYSNAVPSIGGFVGRGVNGRGGMRKSRGRVRT